MGTTYDDMVIGSGGTLTVLTLLNQDLANRTKVNSGGSMYVSSGGTANSTTVNSGGELYVSSGGTADSNTVNSGGELYVSSGGTANSNTVNSSGNMYVSSGGTANNNIVSGWEARLTVSNGGSASHTTIDGGASITVSNGGTASRTTISGGNMYISSGGTANSTTVNRDGNMYISSGGTANSTTISGGNMYISNGGTANSTTVNGGNMTVSSGGTAHSTTVNTYGGMTVSSGGVANSTTVSGGNMYISSGGVANSTTVERGGMTVSNGGTASRTTIRGGRMYVSSGGTANSTTVERGNMTVSSGGTANSTTILVGGQLGGFSFACDLYLKSIANGTATISNGITITGNEMTVSSGGTANSTTVNGGSMYISNGGTANSTTVNGGNMTVSSGGVANNTTVNTYGCMTVSSGGVANSTTVNGYLYWGDGNMIVSSGGTANNTTVNDGNMTVSSGGTANSTTVNGGNMTVSSGGTASIAFNPWQDGNITSEVGATVTYLERDANVYYQKDGVISKTNVWESGILEQSAIVYKNGIANNTIVNDCGNLYVSSGGIANSTTVNGGMYVSSGGVANSTTVNQYGCMYVSSGGTASIAFNPWQNGNITSEVGATVTYLERDANVYYQKDGVISKANVWESGILDQSAIVYENGIANSTTVNGGMTVFCGGTANNTIVNACGNLYVSSGGIANSTTVNGGMYVSSGGVANSTTVNKSGCMFVSSGGTATNAVIASGGRMGVTLASNTLFQGTSNGSAFEYRTSAEGIVVNTNNTLIVSSGGTANSTTVNGYSYWDGGGSMTISSGGVANSTTVNQYGCMYVSSGGTATNAVIASDGWMGITLASNTLFQGTSNGSAFEYRASADGLVIHECKALTVGSGCTANNTTIYGDGSVTVISGGVANNTTLASPSSFRDEGRLKISSGGVANSTTVNFGSIEVCSGGVANNTTLGGGWMFVYSGGVANSTTVNEWGHMYVSSGGIVTGALNITSGATVGFEDGSILNFNTVGRTAADDALLNNFSLIEGTPKCTITVSADQTSKNYKLAGNASGAAGKTFTLTGIDGIDDVSITVGGTAIYGGTDYGLSIDSDQYLVLKKISALRITANSASKEYDGTALICSDYTYTGKLLEGDVLTAVVEGTLTDAGTADNTITSYKVMRGETDVTEEYDIFTQIGTLTITPRDITLNSGSKGVDGDGTTKLTCDTVSYVGNFVGEDGFASYSATGKQTGVGSTANTITYTLNTNTKAGNYNIIQNEGTLTVAQYVAPPTAAVVTQEEPVEEKTEVGLNKTEGVTTVDVGVAKSDASTAKLKVQTTGDSVGIFNAADDYELTAKNAQNYTWSNATDIEGSSSKTTAKEVASDEDGKGDIFFANANGTWGGLYSAHHVGTKGQAWGGTGEYASLAGKNKISDLFTGSTDGNILALTDDANGDALFVDDVYTAFPTGQKSRIASIDEIRAGAGNDIIDMTSQRFDYTAKSGMKIRGGSGDDTIWASKGKNMLFGDAGNDRLVGASGNDVLAGGIGNDSMHGGGGNDIFTFGNDWGTDTIEQITGTGNSVTLWFADAESAIKAEDTADGAVFSYQDTTKTSTVTVKGWLIADLTVNYGDDGSDQYNTLVAAGCFMAESSEKVFETEDKGVIAVI